MTAQPAAIRSFPTERSIEPITQLFIRVLAVWHALIAVGAMIGIASVWFNRGEAAFWLMILISLILAGAAVACGAAVLNLMRLKHSGRVLSLVINYILFMISFIGMMHLSGVFIGIDALAETFGHGIPFLGGAFVGYLIRAFSDRLEVTAPRQQKLLNRIGSIIAVVGLVSFLLAVGFISGLVALVREFDDLFSIGLGLASLVLAALLWMAWRSPTALALNATIRDTEMLEGWLFLSPNLLGFLLFFAGPLLFSLYISFTEWDSFGTQEWIWFQNYAEIFNLKMSAVNAANQPFDQVLDTAIYAELTRLNLFGQSYVIGAQDKFFWISVGNTILFGLLVLPLSVAPALVLANVLNGKLPGMVFFRAVYFLPSIAAVVGVALIWRWLYNSSVGWINYFITQFVTLINGIAGGDVLTDPMIGWISDTKVALLAVVIVFVWQRLGLNAVLYLAGLQSIPTDLYEAATVDGAGVWARFWKITLPMLAPTTFFVVSTTAITALQLFDQLFVLTNPPGGPGTSTMTVVLYLYKSGFQNFRQGYASAVAWVLFLLIFAVTLVQFQRQRSEA